MPELDLTPPFRDVFAAAILPFLYNADITAAQLATYASRPPFKVVIPNQADGGWASQFATTRDNINKAQSAWQGVTGFSIEVPLDEFDLYELTEKRSVRVPEPHFQAVFSLFPRSGVGTVAFWLNLGSVQAHDALQAVDLFKFTDPSAAKGYLRLRNNTYKQVSELAKAYLAKFQDVYSGLFPNHKPIRGEPLYQTRLSLTLSCTFPPLRGRTVPPTSEISEGRRSFRLTTGIDFSIRKLRSLRSNRHSRPICCNTIME